MVSEPVLVVDFGTSTSSGAVVTDGEVVLLQEPAGGWSRPSAVYLNGGEILIGTLAENAGRADPTAYRDEFKRDLGSQSPILLGDKAFRVEELVAEVLASFRRQAEREHGRQIHRAALTIPASYGPSDPRRTSMITAGELAGLSEVELLAEPVAAALAPLIGEPFAAGDAILIYDFGGGTFDAAVVRVTGEGTHEVLGHAALDDCGGRDIDALLAARVRRLGGDRLTELLDPLPEDPNATRHAQHVRMELGELVRRSKHQLSEAVSTRQYFLPARQQLTLDREELAELVAPDLERTLVCCRQLLQQLDRDLDSIDAILMVGGTTRMPVVTETVERALSRPLRFTKDPILAVVRGAASWVRARAGDIHVLPHWPAKAGERPLRWEIPGGSATILRWLVEPGQIFDPETPLVAVRSMDGTIWRLISDDRPAVLSRTQLQSGDLISTGDWAASLGLPPLPPPLPIQAFTARHYYRGDTIAFSPDGRWLAVGCGNGSAVLWDTAAGKRVREFQHAAAVLGVTFSPDAQWLATGCANHDATIWEIKTGEQLKKFQHADAVTSVDFSLDGTLLATASKDGTAAVWNVANGTLVWRVHHNSCVTAVAFDRTGSRIVTASNDHIAVSWDVNTGKRISHFRHKKEVTGVAVSPGGQLVASASSDKTVAIWRAETGQAVRLFQHDQKVNDVVFSPDGCWLATAADGGAAVVWDVVTGQRLHNYGYLAAVAALAFSPDGRWLANSSWNATVRVKPIPPKLLDGR